MADYELFFWEPCLSPHKLGFLAKLAALPLVKDITLIAEEGLPIDRTAQGWSIGEIPSGLRVIVKPSTSAVETLVRNSSARSVHIFSGLRWVPTITLGMTHTIRMQKRFGIMHEPRASEGIAGRARYIQSWLTEGEVRRHTGFVLAIGRHGPPWFASVGYNSNKIFPFAYFLPDPGKLELGAGTPSRIAWVGRLAKEKGIVYFLRALSDIRAHTSVRIVGTGPEQARVERFVQGSRSATYLGALPMADIPSLLWETDILILPSISTNDGWGAVVSEALLCGSTVVATSEVGASVCLGDENNGRIIKAKSAQAIAAAADSLVFSGKLDLRHRQIRREWALRRLTDASGSFYFLSILQHVYEGSRRPEPFYSSNSGQHSAEKTGTANRNPAASFATFVE